MSAAHYPSLAHKRVLIAGASRGLGLTAAMAFADAGARVALGGRNGRTLADAASRLAGSGHFHAPANLSDKAEAEDWVGRAISALGGVDVLLVTLTAGSADSGEDDLRASFETDLLAPVRLLSACRAGLAEARGAALFCSSRTAQSFFPRTMAYGAAKAGLEYAVRCLAADTVHDGIRVNALAPGSLHLEAGFWDRCRQDDPGLWQRTLASLPSGRLGTAEDVLPAILFLCSDAARWITGQTLLADGGQMLAPYVPPPQSE